VDIAKLQDAIDGINETLMRVYARPPGCCKKVKAAILARATTNETLSRLELTYKDIDEIGKELIHESPYNYVTYLNRKTLNDVLQRLIKKEMIVSPYFNVPEQKHRKVYTKFIDVGYKELLLIEAIDRELRAFSPHTLELPVETTLSGDDDLICGIIASSVIHGAMLFKGFHEQLLSVDVGSIDLRNGFMTVRTHDSGDTEGNHNVAFFRYFISPITMVYLLKYVSLHSKELRIINPRLRNGNPRTFFFGERWKEGPGNITLNSVFLQWTETIAKKYDLPLGMELERFRSISMRYLTMKYPIFLLSVQSRALLSYSVPVDHFAPLLNVKLSGPSYDLKTLSKSGKGSDEALRQMLDNNETLTNAVLEIISQRGSIKDKADRKPVAVEIRQKVDEITKAMSQESGEVPPVLGNYQIYWDWLLYLIESTSLSPGSISTYTGSIGRHFMPLLSEKSILTAEKEYIEERILNCIKRYETNDIIKDLRRFFSFIKLQHPEVDLPSLSQKKFLKAICSTPKPLLYFEDMRKVINAVPDIQLRLIILLGFYAGLRAGEIVNLKLSNLIYDGGYVLCVRKSKTKNGSRNIPLYLLMPDEYLIELVTYWKAETSKRRPDGFLFVKKGKKLSKHTSSTVACLFREILGIEMEFHHLRHSFANWVLIRWFAAIYGKDLFEPGCHFLGEEVFNDEYLEKLRLLLFGFRILKKGQNSFSHVFAALARLIGHGSPRITIRYYVHVIDFLMHLYLRRKHGDYHVKLTNKAMAELLNMSHVTLPKYFAGNQVKPLTVQDIVNAQKRRLGLSDMMAFETRQSGYSD